MKISVQFGTNKSARLDISYCNHVEHHRHGEVTTVDKRDDEHIARGNSHAQRANEHGDGDDHDE